MCVFPYEFLAVLSLHRYCYLTSKLPEFMHVTHQLAVQLFVEKKN